MKKLNLSNEERIARRREQQREYARARYARLKAERVREAGSEKRLRRRARKLAGDGRLARAGAELLARNVLGTPLRIPISCIVSQGDGSIQISVPGLEISVRRVPA